MAFQISSPANDDGRENEREDARGDERMRFITCALPLVKNPAPHGAKNDDAGHVKRPRNEIVFAHLRRAHGVKEELEIPAGTGEHAKKIIGEQGNF